MRAMGKIGHFFSNGAAVFREASQGRYNRVSAPVSEMRRELFESTDSRRSDRQNLKRDSMKVASDMRKSYNKIVNGND